jgi:tRNA modification GTPase
MFEGKKHFIKPRFFYTALYRSPFKIMDQINFVFFKKPNSYTGEDLLELHVHGSSTIVKEIINDLLKHEGRKIRAAEAGEFTERAFLNGKFDLIQANSILKKYDGWNVSLSTLSKENLGLLSAIFKKLKTIVFELLTDVESCLNFSYENTITLNVKDVLFKIKLSINILKILLKKNTNNTQTRNLYVGFIGFPNSGKSSLLNKIFNKRISIVSWVRGATRDLINTQLVKFPVIFTDTAGLDNMCSLRSRVEDFTIDKNYILDVSIGKTLAILSKINLFILLFSFQNKRIFPVFFNNLFNKLLPYRTILIFNKKDLLLKSIFNLRAPILKKNLNYFKIIVKKFYKYTTIVKTLKNSIRTLLDLKFFIFQKIKEPLKVTFFTRNKNLMDLMTIADIKRILEKYESLFNYFKEKFIPNSESYLKEVLFIMYSIMKSLKKLDGEYTNKTSLKRFFKKFCVGK